MSKPSIDELVERVQSLERSRCRLSRGLVAVSLVAGLLLASGGARPDDPRKAVVAEEFVLKDRGGKVKAWLMLNPDGLPNLTYFDGQGKPRLSLDLSGSGPEISLIDAAGETRTSLGLNGEGAPFLSLSDTRGHRFAVGPGGDGTLVLGLTAADGGAVGLHSSSKSSGLTISGPRKRTKVGLISDNALGGAALHLCDDGGKPYVVAYTTRDGSPNLTLLGPNDRPLLQVPDRPPTRPMGAGER